MADTEGLNPFAHQERAGSNPVLGTTNPEEVVTAQEERDIMGKRCLRCGTNEGITRDHVISRFILRTVLSRAQYEDFCQKTSKNLNKQPLCGPCNQEKGPKAIDYRGQDMATMLQGYLLIEYGVLVDIEVVK